MDANKIALEITRLKMRAFIHEFLLLHLRLLLPVATMGVSVDESQRLTLDTLEASAKELEVYMFATDEYGALTDAERALYADEVRETFEKMKSLVEVLADDMKGKQRRRHEKR